MWCTEEENKRGEGDTQFAVARVVVVTVAQFVVDREFVDSVITCASGKPAMHAVQM